MADPVPPNGNGLSIKELLLKMDGKLDSMDGRVTVLENWKIAQDAVSGERRHVGEEWKWRVGVLFGLCASVAFGVLNLWLGK